MTRKEWAKIKQAAEMLGLEDRASLPEIKRAYRRLSKKHHPDMVAIPEKSAEKIEMHKLTEAYEALMNYCSEYRFPLTPGDDVQPDGEDWWFERFGQDHHWGKGSVPQEDYEE